MPSVACRPDVALIAVETILPAGVALTWRRLQAIDRRVRVPEREVALLWEAALFASLAPPQLESVAGRTRWVTLEPGEVLIREGDPGDRCFVLETGGLDVTRERRRLKRMSSHGDGLGEIALLHNVPRTANVRAVAPCVLLSLERADFLEAVTGHEQVREAAERVVGVAGSRRSTAGPTGDRAAARSGRAVSRPSASPGGSAAAIGRRAGPTRRTGSPSPPGT